MRTSSILSSVVGCPAVFGNLSGALSYTLCVDKGMSNSKPRRAGSPFVNDVLAGIV